MSEITLQAMIDLHHARLKEVRSQFETDVEKAIALEQRLADLDKKLRDLAEEEKIIIAEIKKLCPNYEEPDCEE